MCSNTNTQSHSCWTFCTAANFIFAAAYVILCFLSFHSLTHSLRSTSSHPLFLSRSTVYCFASYIIRDAHTRFSFSMCHQVSSEFKYLFLLYEMSTLNTFLFKFIAIWVEHTNRVASLHRTYMHRIFFFVCFVWRRSFFSFLSSLLLFTLPYMSVYICNMYMRCLQWEVRGMQCGMVASKHFFASLNCCHTIIIMHEFTLYRAIRFGVFCAHFYSHHLTSTCAIECCHYLHWKWETNERSSGRMVKDYVLETQWKREQERGRESIRFVHPLKLLNVVEKNMLIPLFDRRAHMNLCVCVGSNVQRF